MRLAKSLLEAHVPSLLAAYRSLVSRVDDFRPGRRFDKIYRSGYWGGKESRSGPGSDWCEARYALQALESAVRWTGARSLLDAACGDFNWMGGMRLESVDYLGVDLVAGLIAENRRLYERPGIRFDTGNIAVHELPCADLVLCRDCLVHLSNDLAARTLKNIARSSKYLLLTTFPKVRINRPIATGKFRPINLELDPFFLPRPVKLYPERPRATGPESLSKSLGLWPSSAVDLG